MVAYRFFVDDRETIAEIPINFFFSSSRVLYKEGPTSLLSCLIS